MILMVQFAPQQFNFVRSRALATSKQQSLAAMPTALPHWRQMLASGCLQPDFSFFAMILTSNQSLGFPFLPGRIKPLPLF
jgi:hypothetical protein